MEDSKDQQSLTIEIEDDGSHSKIRDYIIIKYLDKGAQGKVKLCSKNGQIFAIKIHKSVQISEEDKADMRREINAIQQVGEHHNILKLVDYFEDEDYIRKNGKGTYKATCIVLEYIDNGCLFDYVKAMGGFHHGIAKFYFKHQIEALQHMHNRGVSHRDVKLENTLLDRNFVLKICDFGFAGKTKELLYDNLGTQSYKAPEIARKKGYFGEKADVFSAGVCFFIFSFGHYPFSKATLQDNFYKMFMNKNETFWKKHMQTLQNNGKRIDFIDNDFIDLMNHMLINDYDKRWSTQQVLESPYMQREEEIKVNQEMISFNLNRFREQVNKDREEDIQQQKDQKKNTTGYQDQDSNGKKGRDVPQELEEDIKNIQAEFNEDLQQKKGIPFPEQIFRSANYNQSLQIVLLNSQVEAVLVYILRQINVPGFELEKIEISKNKAGKITAEYQGEEDEEGEFETLEVSTTVELVEKTERKQDEEQFMVFQIGLVRKQGQYLEFRNAQEQFEELSKQFA